MPPTLSSTIGTDTPAPALEASGVNIGDAADVDLADSHDPHLLIPGDPVTLLAAARALVHNADLHDTLAIRQRRLHDGGWSGAAADAFHAHLTRQATRHAGAADATRTAARALTELADGIDQARTQARRAALLHADGDPDQRTGRSDPGLREQAHDLLADTRAALEDLNARVRAQLALAHNALPNPDRLLTDFAALTVVGGVARGAYSTTPTPIPPAGAGPSETADATPVPSTDGAAPHQGSSGGAMVRVLASDQRPRRQIVVRAGDTLSGIATRELGDPARWPEILDANPTVTHPWQIQPGQHLTLPDNSAPDDLHQPVADQPGSGHPPPTPPRPHSPTRQRARHRSSTPPTMAPAATVAPAVTPAASGWRRDCSSGAGWPQHSASRSCCGSAAATVDSDPTRPAATILAI
jgi:nucleoid-associated protein YgaU